MEYRYGYLSKSIKIIVFDGSERFFDVFAAVANFFFQWLLESIIQSKFIFYVFTNTVFMIGYLIVRKNSYKIGRMEIPSGVLAFILVSILVFVATFFFGVKFRTPQDRISELILGFYMLWVFFAFNIRFLFENRISKIVYK